MFKIKYTMTMEEHKEYLRLKAKSPQMSEADLFTAITGSFLCLGKTLFNQLGYSNITKVFMNGSTTFFWILIIIGVFKGIKKLQKNCNHKTKVAGVSQLIGSGISTLFMLR